MLLKRYTLKQNPSIIVYTHKHARRYLKPKKTQISIYYTHFKTDNNPIIQTHKPNESHLARKIIIKILLGNTLDDDDDNFILLN